MAFLRYQTVRNVGLGVLGAGAIAGVVAVAIAGGGPTPSKVPEPTGAQPLTSPPQKTVAAVDPVRVIERASYTARPGEKIKDAWSGQPLKLNLYEETNDAAYDRLKLDVDRDDVWDHEWTRTASGLWARADGQVFMNGGWSAQGSDAPKPPEPVVDQMAKVAAAMLTPTKFSKVSDLFGGEGAKVNLYDDDNDGTWDRGKVDYERDEVDDEKLTMKGGVLERKTEKTGVVTVWKDGAWVTGAPVAVADPQADAMTKVAAAMLQPAKGDKIKDLFNGSGAKVNLYDDNKDGTWDRAKVDYERDEVDDEKLTLKGGVLERKVQKTGVVTIWKDGAWVAKP